MKTPEQRLEEIIKEELQKEGLFDFFKKKKSEPASSPTAAQPEDLKPVLDGIHKKFQSLFDDPVYIAKNRHGVEFHVVKDEVEHIGQHLIDYWNNYRKARDMVEEHPRDPETKRNVSAAEYALTQLIFAAERLTKKTRERFGESEREWEKRKAELERRKPPAQKQVDDYYDFISQTGGKLASLTNMEETKTNDSMASLMENWRGYEKKTLLTEQPEPEARPRPDDDDHPQPAAAQKPKPDEGEGMKIVTQTSFKVFDGKPDLAAKVMQSILKGGPTFKALQAAQGEYAIKSPELIKQWVDSIGGIGVFAKRAAAIGAKIPEQGLAKKDMPFLPGPEDAQGEPSDIEDALKPGGKFNVDIMEKTTPPAPNTFIGMKDPVAQDYMQAGLKDGDPDDDNIEIKMNGEFPAAKGIPTQTNILFPKALGMALHGDNGKPLVGGKIGAYASTEGHILDGHHRWAATMLNDPSANIGTFAMIDMNKAGMMDTLKHLTAIGNALGNKTKPK